MPTKRVAVLTSGGDAPGMNAAIRAVVRTGLDKGWEMVGVRRGYAGLLDADLKPLGARDVGGILGRGGTVLGSARCPEFEEEKHRRRALANLETLGIGALVVIGGNGSQAGAHAVHAMGFPVVGIASTIDNDLAGTEMTIGVDTALDIALESIDRLRTTASSHRRAFLVEVMGRDCGYLALMAGIAGGAEAIVIPERELTYEEIAHAIRAAHLRGKTHGLVVVAEGVKFGALHLYEHFQEHRDEVGFDVRMTTLGHVQRGGAPGAYDRLLATRFGAAATDALERKEPGVMVGLAKGEVRTAPLEEIVGRQKPLDLSLLDLAKVLAK
ncbi:MAG TPA: 6-phosphofructokinase [Anaeromyxobacteraceae bacterium]|nr:6-phosphofructokinase [Anaeromyxobacteraceae bacterium]